MSSITYKSFNNLLVEFINELRQTYDEYPELSNAHETLRGLLDIDDTITTPMDTFYETFSEYSNHIMNKDDVLFAKCSIPFTQSFDLNKVYGESDEDTRSAIWNYLQQLFVTATTVQNMPTDMFRNIEAVANACMEKVRSGEVTEEEAQNPLFILQQLQQNPLLMDAMQHQMDP